MKEKQTGCKRVDIGGQAVMEGVMMKAPKAIAIAVRRPDHTIVVRHEESHSPAEKHKWMGWPFVRGAVSLVTMMSMGMKVTAGILIGAAVTAFIYGLLYFLKFRKLKGENPGIQGKFDKDSVKDFNIFGTQKKFKMQPYSRFNKKYENKYTFFMRFDGMKLLFIPKKYLSIEEIEYIRKKIK